LAGATLAVALASAVRAEDAAPPDAPPGAVEASAPAVAPPSEPAPPRVALAIDRLERAWSTSASSLGERSERTRAVADEIGVGSLDPLARALLWDAHDSASDFDRASAAAQLAPDLPLAQGALAEAQWSRRLRRRPQRADAVPRSRRNPDGWLWLSITGWLARPIRWRAVRCSSRRIMALSAAHSSRYDLGDAPDRRADLRAIALLLAVVLAPARSAKACPHLGVGLVALLRRRFARATHAVGSSRAPLTRRAPARAPRRPSIAALGAGPRRGELAAGVGLPRRRRCAAPTRATGANADVDPPRSPRSPSGNAIGGSRDG
jgi:hypothetical protein